MVEFMKTKDRCLQCGEKLSDDIYNRLYVDTEEGLKQFCNAYCMDQWQNAYDDLPY